MSIFNAQIAWTGFNFHQAVNDAHSRKLAGAGGKWPVFRKRHVSQPFRRWTTHFASLILPLIFLGGAASHASAQIIETVAGGGVGDGGPANTTTITSRRIAVDASGNLYIPDAFNNNNGSSRNRVGKMSDKNAGTPHGYWLAGVSRCA